MKTIFLLLLLIPCACFASTDIEIKGIRIGMNSDDYYQKLGAPSKFTIAGIHLKEEWAAPITTNDNDGNLESFTFYFDSEEFASMQGAIKKKYPKIKCTTNAVSNAFGATFDDVFCSISDKTSVLILHKYVDLKTSSLDLYTQAVAKKILKKEKDRAKDL
jgi:hypothetical protein